MIKEKRARKRFQLLSISFKLVKEGRGDQKVCGLLGQGTGGRGQTVWQEEEDGVPGVGLWAVLKVLVMMSSPGSW